MKQLEMLKQQWSSLSNQHRRWLKLSSTLLLLFLAVYVLILPAYQTIKQAPLLQQKLQQQLQLTNSLAKEAAEIKQLPPMPASARFSALKQTSQSLLGDSGKLSNITDSTIVTLQQSSSEQLVKWLQQTQISARALPSEVNLTRSKNMLWDGNIVFIINE